MVCSGGVEPLMVEAFPKTRILPPFATYSRFLLLSNDRSKGVVRFVTEPEMVWVGATLPLCVLALSKIKIDAFPWLATNNRSTAGMTSTACGRLRVVAAPLMVAPGDTLPVAVRALLK